MGKDVEQNVAVDSDIVFESDVAVSKDVATPASGATSDDTSVNTEEVQAVPKKKRGRPPGAKNKDSAPAARTTRGRVVKPSMKISHKLAIHTDKTVADEKKSEKDRISDLKKSWELANC